MPPARVENRPRVSTFQKSVRSLLVLSFCFSRSLSVAIWIRSVRPLRFDCSLAHALRVIMDMDKSPHFELQEPMDGERSPEEKDVSYIKPGTAQDNADMHRLGKKQQLSRGFHSISIFGLTCVIMLTWQAILSTSTFSLINGGRAGSVYSYLASWLLTSEYRGLQSTPKHSCA